MKYLAVALIFLALPLAAHAQDDGPEARPEAVLYVPQQASGASSGLERVRRRIQEIGPTSAPRVVVYPLYIESAPAVVSAPSPGDLTPPDGTAADALRRSDLYRLETALVDRLDRRLDELERRLLRAAASTPTRQGPPVIVLPDDADADRLQAYLDSLRAMAARPAPVPEPEEVPARAPSDEPSEPVAPTPELIERSLLDTGLFQALQVNFAFDEATLLPSAEPTLEAVAEVLERHPDLRIAVAGHTDSIGSEDYNERLSAARAGAVRDYLVQVGGIEPARLAAAGYGEQFPLLSNATPTGRAMNRRVAFVALNPEDALREDRTEDLRSAIEEAVREALQE